jgi:hypothetical protein
MASRSSNASSTSAQISKDITTHDAEFLTYVRTLKLQRNNAHDSDGRAEEIRTTPLFTWPVRMAAAEGTHQKVEYAQYGLLGHEIKHPGRSNAPLDDIVEPIFLNTNTPWSVFICGSQGSGKSHTMSTMLENCLVRDPRIGRLPMPLSGMVFHYDTHSFGSVCEAAYIASTKIPVRVLVSPSNQRAMKEAYRKILNGNHSIQVMPLKLQPKHINTERMMKLMAVTDSSSGIPLYMEVGYPLD